VAWVAVSEARASRHSVVTRPSFAKGQSIRPALIRVASRQHERRQDSLRDLIAKPDPVVAREPVWKPAYARAFATSVTASEKRVKLWVAPGRPEEVMVKAVQLLLVADPPPPAAY